VERPIRARATCCARSCRLRLWIENDQGERIFYVDAKVLRVRDTVLIKDRSGNELVKLQKRLLRARNTMAIERGDTVARSEGDHRTVARPVHHRASRGAAPWKQMGTSWITSTKITHDGIPVANISKRWFRVRESYGVAVAPGQDDALILAVTVCIDHLTD
jgi:uncharacterized protein YxjI